MEIVPIPERVSRLNKFIEEANEVCEKAGVYCDSSLSEMPVKFRSRDNTPYPIVPLCTDQVIQLPDDLREQRILNGCRNLTYWEVRNFVRNRDGWYKKIN